MIATIREQFNQHFSIEKYHQYLDELMSKHPGAIEFRVAETPLFIDKIFTQKMIAACESIVDVITQSDFIKNSEKPSRLMFMCRVMINIPISLHSILVFVRTKKVN